MQVRRTATRANSVATKNPLARTRATTATRASAGLIETSSVWPARPVPARGRLLARLHRELGVCRSTCRAWFRLRRPRPLRVLRPMLLRVRLGGAQAIFGLAIDRGHDP